MSEMVSIVIPAFNQLEYCRQCVHSVRAYTRQPFRLILVDNGSTDGVGEFFDAEAGGDVIAVHAPVNLGFAGGVNLGLERAEGHPLLLNSDTLVPEGWLERLVAAMMQSPDIGMVGPRSNCVSGAQQIDGLALASLDEINAFARDLAIRNAGKVRDAARLVGFCLLIRDKVFSELGPFDDRYGIGNFEDDDYCIRALRAGYRLCVAEDAFVFHYGSRTFLGMGMGEQDWQELIRTNEQRFYEKWQAAPEERCDAAQESKRLNRKAQEAVARGDVKEALELFKAAIESFPLLEANYNDLGVLLWQMGETDRAFQQFARALRLNKNYAAARDNLLAVARILGRQAEAIQLLDEQAAPSNGGSPQAQP